MSYVWLDERDARVAHVVGKEVAVIKAEKAACSGEGELDFGALDAALDAVKDEAWQDGMASKDFGEDKAVERRKALVGVAIADLKGQRAGGCSVSGHYAV